MRIKDISNQKFGKLTAVEFTGRKTKSGNAIWKCLCECGKYVDIPSGQLTSGQTKSCGCLLLSVNKRENLYESKDNYYIGHLRNSKGIFFFDKEDFDIVSKYCWRNTSNGYLMTSTNTNGKHKQILMHRLIMGLSDSNMQIDHINGNKSDNRKSNLRVATSSQNGINKDKNSNNTIGYKGVSKNKKGYMARIKKDYKTYYLGTFDTPEKAYVARKRAEKEMFGEFAYKGCESNAVQ